MKKLILMFLLFPGIVWAQSVSFTKNVYKIDEDVTATLVAKAEGVSNGIKAQSTGSTPAGSINLGRTSIPGYYLVSFVFGTRTEQYFVLVLPTAVNPGTTTPTIKPIAPADPKYHVFLNKLIEFTKEKGSITAILNRVVTKYVAAYPVQGPVTLVACVGAPLSGMNPVFTFTCKQGLVPMAKDLGIFFLEACNEELYAKKKYAEADYKFYKGNIAVMQYVINAYTAEGVLDAFSAIANVTGTDAGDQLSYGASITDQFVKKYQFILKFKK